MVANIEVIRQNVFSHARVMVISVGSDLIFNVHKKKTKKKYMCICFL